MCPAVRLDCRQCLREDSDTTIEQPLPRPASPDSYCDEGDRLLKSGAALVAYDILSEGLREFPDHVRIRQLVALSLARVGASRPANEILRGLTDQGHADEETLGLLARTYKDLWAESADPVDRRRHLEMARRHYTEAHRLSRGYWSGINAATMALLLGERDEASAVARSVGEQCRALRDADPARADLYYVLATLGEAALVQQQWTEAEAWYAQAAAIGRERPGDLASTRRNARLILQHLQADEGLLDACLPVPRVVVFAGHLIDRPERTRPRFPPALEPVVSRAILEYLRRHDVGLGYASAGCGADILFLESLARIGARTHVVLPYNREQFRQDSVDFVPEADWGARYERVLDQATDLVVASEQRMVGGGASYEFGFRMLDGVAGVRADELDTELACLAVWDGRPSEGPGGTATSVEHWRRQGRQLEIIEMDRLLSEHGPLPVSVTAPAAPVSPPDPATDSRGFDPEIVGLLFADAHGFSKLNEEELPRFVEHFLGTIAAELEQLPSPPLITNTWGDGLYLVLRHVRDAGAFALRLSEAIRETDWISKGFRKALGLRIGLHAGPAYACLDPVTRRPNYIGMHVSRAARIEPITPPGEVYASGAFAALARSEGVREFTCAYVGQTPLAKGYGTYPTYVVHWRPTGV
jgi:class 3 adenylate cyclase/tetratricopeptide (TPR) repeat protein